MHGGNISLIDLLQVKLVQTQGWSDAWFVGYTPQIAAGCWYGVDDFRVPLGPGQDGSKAAFACLG